jgi:hypothetical protein
MLAITLVLEFTLFDSDKGFLLLLESILSCWKNERELVL